MCSLYLYANKYLYLVVDVGVQLLNFMVSACKSYKTFEHFFQIFYIILYLDHQLIRILADPHLYCHLIVMLFTFFSLFI